MKEKGEVKPHAPVLDGCRARLTVGLQLLTDKLYESCFESQLLMVYDQNKQLQACRDAWPTWMKLKKGSFTVPSTPV